MMHASQAAPFFYKCLHEESQAISAAAHQILVPDLVKVIEGLPYPEKHPATSLFTSGVGKSSYIAKKCAATFRSFGCISHYLDPINSVHGDLGCVRSGDACIIFSNSGETPELITLTHHLRDRCVKLVGITGQPNSTLAGLCNTVFHTGVNCEPGPLHLAPMTSTTVAMAVSDALAAAWSASRGTSPHDFARHHPSGALGAALKATAEKIMVPVAEAPPLRPESSLREVLARLTLNLPRRGSMGATWIAGRGNRIAGLITDGDLRRGLQKYPQSTWATLTAAMLATSTPTCICASTLAIEALRIMESNPRRAITIVPVLDELPSGKVVGFLRLHDIAQAGIPV